MGHSFAAVQLAAKYLNGDDGVKKNLENAAKFYLKAAEGGNPLALHKLGIFCEQGGLKGAGGFTINGARAKGYYEQAASQGYLNSCHNLATLLEGETKGVKADIPLAEKLYKYAAHRGHAESALALFRFYYDPDDEIKQDARTTIGKNVDKGLTYLYIAARAGGSPLAMRLLGQMHGVMKSPIYDTAAAEQWLTLVYQS